MLHTSKIENVETAAIWYQWSLDRLAKLECHRGVLEAETSIVAITKYRDSVMLRWQELSK